MHPETRCPVAAYQTTLVQTLADFERLSELWPAFLDRIGEERLSLSFEWLRLWMRFFPSQWLVILVHDGEGNWMGAAPFKIARGRTGLTNRLMRSVQFIGTDPTVYESMEIVVAPEADDVAVIHAVAGILIKHRTRWDILDLQFTSRPEQLSQLVDA